MTVQCWERPAEDDVHPHDRHVVTPRCWTRSGPSGVETIVCSLACIITVACRWLPAAVGAAAAISVGTESEAAA
jgi:hypothetical protein